MSKMAEPNLENTESIPDLKADKRAKAEFFLKRYVKKIPIKCILLTTKQYEEI